jgi:hypothetical protein
MCEWALTLRPTEEDEYGILGVLNTLALAYNCVRKTSNNQSKEQSRCRGIDDIIEIAFSARTDCHCDYKHVLSFLGYIHFNLGIRTEESYHLVASNGNPDAQSDTLVTIPSKKISDKLRDVQVYFTNPGAIDNLYWSTSGVRDLFSIIGFAGEFKKDNLDCNENQLIMVLTTTQSQRKALSLKNSIIMGATGCHGRVKIYSSYWSSDNDSVRG